MRITRCYAGACALGFLLSVGTARADASLTVAPVKPGQIRVDGELGEWRNARFTKLDEQAPDAALRYAFAFDDNALYLAAHVKDDSMVRSAAPSRGEDALVLTLVAPRAKGAPEVIELWLFAGITGKSASKAAMAAPGAPLQIIEGAKILEGPAEQGAGYVLEAQLPWSQIDGAQTLLLGRGALRMHDVDKGSSDASDAVASASGAPAKLPELLFDGGPSSALAAFVREKGLPPSDKRFERFGDVTGDEHLERVLVAGSYLLVASADRSGGFRFIDLPIAVGTVVKDLVLEDLDDDGRLEVIVSLREPESDARLSYRDEAGRFVLHAQERTPNAKAAAAQAAAAASAARAKPGVSTPPTASRLDEVPVAEDSIVYDKPPGMDELVAAFRETRGVPAGVRARFLTHVNLAEDAAIESLMLFDRDLLVVGKGFRGGLGFFYFGLPVATGADIQRVFTGDVTGDGRREVFVRVKQFVGDIQREILIGYTFADDVLKPILQTEVRRAQRADSVGNIVGLEKAGRHFALRIEPGVAHGYTRESYPFVTERTDSYGALLLPWMHEAVVYRWDGEQLVPR
jgi:hypothetical protein